MPSLKRSVGRKGRRVCFGRNEVLLTVRTSWEMRLQILLDLCALKLPGKERPTWTQVPAHRQRRVGSSVQRPARALPPEPWRAGGPGGGRAGGGAGGGEAGGGGAGGGGAGEGQEEGRWSLLQLCAHSRYAIDLFNM